MTNKLHKALLTFDIITTLSSCAKENFNDTFYEFTGKEISNLQAN